MFLGQYEHTIDDKGRLAIPVRFRSDLADGLYVTAGVDRCLVILTPQAFQATADGVAALPWLSADARQVQRNLFAMATHLVPDKLGRIVLPPYLRTHAGLSGEVVVAGVYDRVEVWDRATWDAVRAEFLNGDSTRLENLAGSLSRGPETA